MNRFSHLALPISLLAFVAACSSNNDNGPPSTPPDAGDDVATDALPSDGGDDAADTTPADTGVDAPPVTKGEGWDTDYALPGVMGLSTAQVSAIVVTSKRWIYVGGSFHHAGEVAANNVAVWNGAKWSAVGDGLPGEVISLAKNATDEVFAVVRKNSDYIVFKWDGAKWTDLTAQPDDQIRSVDVAADGTVWIAGFFKKLGTKSISGVARLKDGAWSAVGSIGDHPLEVVRATPTGACVGGSAQAGEIVVSCWNGTTWQARKNGIYSGMIKALRLDKDGKLIAAGEFTMTEELGNQPGSIARWNTTTNKWEMIGGGVTGATGGAGNVTAIAVDGEKIYLTGRFADAGGVQVRSLAMWTGKKWLDLEGGLAKPYGLTVGDAPLGEALAVDDGGELYVGGKLTRAGARNAMYVGHFNGSSWSAVDDPKLVRKGVNGPVNTIVVTDDGKTTYAGGNFSHVGADVNAENVGKLDATGWHSLGPGLNGMVASLAVKGDDLYAAGWFTGSGSTSSGDPIVPAKSIAKWNGSAWSAIGSGFDNSARAIGFAPDGKMWVGGEFENAGETPASRIAVWDGAKWSAVGKGLSDGSSTRVSAILFHDGKVYVGGDFTKAGDKDAHNVAVWDGAQWSNLGDGLSEGAVDSLAIYGGKLVAGGAFAKSGTKDVRHLAAWDGTTWTEIGGGLPHHSDTERTVLVQSIGVRGTDLFITGLIEKAGTTSVSHFARWDGSTWSDLGGGLNDVGEDLFVAKDSLWVAGTFSGVGNKVPSIGIARYWFAK